MFSAKTSLTRSRIFALPELCSSPVEVGSVILSALFLMSSFAAVTARAQGIHTPRNVQNGTAKLLQHYAANQTLRLSIGLRPPHLAEEKKLIEQLHDKKSPFFHKFLTANEFNARFAPSAADEQAVVAWAQSAGLKVTNRFANRLVVSVEAPAGVIENALGITINQYSVDGETHFSNDRDPVLPAQVANIVQAVEGLNSFERGKPASNRGAHTPLPDYTLGPPVSAAASATANAGITVQQWKQARNTGVTANITNGGLDPQDLYSSQGYDFAPLNAQRHCCNPRGNPGVSPPVSTIALATFGDINYDDINGFVNTFPYLALNVQKIFIDGGYTCATGFDDNCLEATLDTEWSLAMANSFGSYLDTAKVYVYESSGNWQDMYNQMLSDGYARVSSTSWSNSDGISASPAFMQAMDNIFSAMVVQGWTLLSASGDQGATAACSDQLAVNFPASNPNFVAVGGTELFLYSNDTFDSEVAWTGGTGTGSCKGNNGGSTGGYSSYFPAPSYQYNIIFGYRGVPDISLNSGGIAQPVYFQGGLSNWEGTSIASPEMAGFFAQENAYLLAIGYACGSGSSACAPLGNANYNLYGSLLQSAPHYPFYDIVSGCNSNDITALYGLTPFCAGPGYDSVTGWGSANMLQLAWAITWSVAGTGAGPSVSFSGPSPGAWYNSNQIVSWSVIDNASSGTAPTGLAGFTQGWDSIPTDPPSEKTPGSGNSFYSGPEFPNASSGCLSLTGASGCAGGVNQGCHTAEVQAWNNMGKSSGVATYGPICYDTVPPTASALLINGPNSAGWINISPVTLILSAADPGGSAASGVSHIFYEQGPCCLSTYQSSITVPATATYHFLAEDHAGNFGPLQTVVIQIDTVKPTTSATLSGTLNGAAYTSAVQATLTASDDASGVAATTYSLDGGVNTTYSAPFTVSTVGSHTVKYFSTDVAGNVEATHTVMFMIEAVPSVVSVSPTSGIALSQVFTAAYSDSGGAAAINSAYLLFNTSISSANGCYVQYYPYTNLLYLKNDAGTGVSAGIAPGSSATASNSHCTLSGTGSSYGTSGDTATLKVALTFAGTAPVNTYLYSADKDGLNSGWQQVGAWGLVVPSVVSVTPNSGSALSQAFTAVYSDADGASALNELYILFNTSVSGTGACWVEYNPFSKLLYLQGNTTGVAPGSTATASNSRCILSGTGSSYTTSGKTATLTAALTFTSTAFSNIYLLSSDKDGKTSGFVQKGVWGIPVAPTVTSLTPNSGTGSVQTFSAVFSDTDGASGLNAAYLLVNTSVSGANACYVQYIPSTNLLSLKNDAGTALAGSITPGSTATVSNSKCTVAGSGSSYTVSGNIATWTVALTLTGSTLDNVYLYASDKDGLHTGWVKEGTWTP